MKEPITLPTRGPRKGKGKTAEKIIVIQGDPVKMSPPGAVQVHVADPVSRLTPIGS